MCDLVNPVENGKYEIDMLNSPYKCTRRVFRMVSLFFFALVLITSAFFYAQIILTLRRGPTVSSRKKTLTVTFICLWLFWLLQSAPFVLYDFYEVWSTAVSLLDSG